MNANELRIGNLVQWSGNIHEINAIDEHYFAVRKKNLQNMWLSLNVCFPIDISENLLLKLGFIKHEITGSYIKTPTGTSNGYGLRFHTQYPNTKKMFNSVTEVSYFEQQLYVRNGMKHVHQLQNLYFSLCGEDLVFSTEP